MDLTQSLSDFSTSCSKPIAIDQNKPLPTFLMMVFGLISMTVPFGLFLLYQTYALKEGITIEPGCHGPGVPFGMLSGILMALQFRLAHKDQNRT